MSFALVLFATSALGYAFGSVIYFILWIAVMVWIYNIAKRKGRHAIGRVILAFFFFFLALILILLLPSKRTTQRVWSPECRRLGEAQARSGRRGNRRSDFGRHPETLLVRRDQRPVGGQVEPGVGEGVVVAAEARPVWRAER